MTDKSIELEVKILSDDLLFEKLSNMGVSVGPIVATTRKIYQNKLIRLLGGEVDDSPYAEVENEGYSDEEQENYVSNERSMNTSFSTRQPPSPTLRSRTSNMNEKKKSIFSDSLSFDHDRHTPSPRPSLRTVTSSTSTTTATKYMSPTGNVRETRSYREIYSTPSKENLSPEDKYSPLARTIVKFMFILILAVALYFTYQYVFSESPFYGLENLAKQALDSANKNSKKVEQSSKS